MDDIAGDDISGGNVDPGSVSEDEGIDTLEFLKGFNSLLGIVILIDTDDSVQNENGENNQRFNPAGDGVFFVVAF